MTRYIRRLLLTFCIVFCIISIASLVPLAQLLVVPLDDETGHVALGLALRHLSNTGIFLHTTAHPDDENNALLVMLNRGQGIRTALATATRGNGGQNEIGPELFEALGVLRTEELAAVHRFDAAEQYFTRAVDFGYSFSIEETFQKWGRDEITADYVRLIRTIRPDVVVSLMPDGTGGGQHHQASAIITHDAVKLAGDATKYPEQIKAGLRPWQPRKYYQLTGFGPAGPEKPSGRVTAINLSVYDPLLGKTYEEIGSEERSMHKSQGMGQLLALPGPMATSYRLVESTIPGQADRDEKSLFDGIETSVVSLGRYAGNKPPKDLTEGLAIIEKSVQAAQRAYDTQTDAATVSPLLDGLHATRVLRAELGKLSVDDNGRYEIDFRLRQKEREFQQALVQANGVRVVALADDGVVVPGQQVKLDVIVANHGNADINVKQVAFEGFAGQVNCQLRAATARPMFPGQKRPEATGPTVSVLHRDQVAECEPAATIPADARVNEPYWHRKDEEGRYTFDPDAPFGLPFRPTPFYVQVTFAIGNSAPGDEVIDGLPVQYRYQGNIFSGEKRMDLLVAPAYSVRVDPEIAILPAGQMRRTPTSTRRPVSRSRAAGATGSAEASGRAKAAGSAKASAERSDRSETATGREVRVTVTNDSPGAANNVVRLQLPDRWSADPAEQPVKFTRAGEAQTVRFEVRPGAGAATGEYHVKALISADGKTFDRGYQVIEYPHTRRRNFYRDADVTMKIVDVKTAPNLMVGYVMGVGDQVPPAIEQLGAKVEMLDTDELAFGDLSRFDVIVTGVRAYERRPDLRANNARLLEYVSYGGTLIVQYNKFEFNEAQYAPYPAKVSSNRVTDENSPVRVLEPENPVFNTPNKITDATWRGWVQERGLYFLGEKDSRYHDLVSLEDPFPYNKGEKRGALVETQYGKGRWFYVGLGLWRQLPAGTDGAYQLLANLISLPKAAPLHQAPTAKKGR